MRTRHLILVASLISFCIYPSFAQSAEGAASAELLHRISILDTSDIERASAMVEERGTIEFSVETASGDLAEGIEITLSNTATSEMLTAVAVNGTVIFDSVAPGIWTVASTAPDITFTGISISAAGTATALTGSTLSGLFSGISGSLGATSGVTAAGIAVAGGAIAVSQATDDSSSTPLSPSR